MILKVVWAGALVGGFALCKFGFGWVWLTILVAVLGFAEWTYAARQTQLETRARERDLSEAKEAVRELKAGNDDGILMLTQREKNLLSELDARRWLDAVIHIVYTKYEHGLSDGLRDILDGVVGGLCPLGPIAKLFFRKCELGKHAPRIGAVRANRLQSPNMIELDVELEHLGALIELEVIARLSLGGVPLDVPLKLNNVSFEAVLRIRVEMCDRAPYINVLEIAFAYPPRTLDFALGLVGGNITGIPNIAALIKGALDGLFQDLMVWPNSIRLPLDEWNHPGLYPPNVCVGVMRLTVERAVELPGADFDGFSDPYVVLQVDELQGAAFVERERFTTTVKSKNLNPVWSEDFAVRTIDPTSERLLFKVYDMDVIGADELLGTAELSRETLKEIAFSSRPRGLWLRLQAPPHKKTSSWFSSSSSTKGPPTTNCPRLYIRIDFAPCEPSKAAFLNLEDHDGSAAEEEAVLVKKKSENELTAALLSEVKAKVQEAKVQTADEEEEEEVPLFPRKILKTLYMSGTATLMSGYLQKEGFSAFKRWHKRFFTLELALEYNYEGEKLQVAATLLYHLEREVKARHKESDKLEGQSSSSKHVHEVEDEDTAASKADGRRLLMRTARNVCRLSPGDTVRAIDSTAIAVKMKNHAKIWKFRCSSPAEAELWRSALELALKPLTNETRGKKLHVAAKRACEEETKEPSSPKILLPHGSSIEEMSAPGSAYGVFLVVEIVECRGLISVDDNGLADPFVVLTMGEQKYQTRCIRESLEPKFLEATEFQAGAGGYGAEETKSECAGLLAQTSVLKVEVCDEDLGFKPKLMSCTEIKVDTLLNEVLGKRKQNKWAAALSPSPRRPKGKKQEVAAPSTMIGDTKWYTLHNEDGKPEGEIRLRLTTRLFQRTLCPAMRKAVEKAEGKHLRRASKVVQAAKNFTDLLPG